MNGSPSDYQRAKLAVFLAETAFELLLLAFLAVSGASIRLEARVSAIAGGASLWLYPALLFNLLFAAGLPAKVYSGFVLEKRFGLATQALAGWLSDLLKRYLLSMLLFVPTTVALLCLIRSLPGGWWIAAAAGWLLLSFVLMRLFPVAIIPLFYKTSAVPEGPLRSRILSLCERLGVGVLDIRQIELSAKTRKANAAVVGIGGSRRILLSDTLLKNFPDEEVEMVVAHELGHHRLRHVRRSFVMQTVATAAGFLCMSRLGDRLALSVGTSGLGDLAALPLVLLLGSLGGLLWMPAQNGHSRHMENEADLFALRALPDARLFRSLMERLARLNLAHSRPHPLVEWLFYDHPSIANRIRLAERHFSAAHEA